MNEDLDWISFHYDREERSAGNTCLVVRAPDAMDPGLPPSAIFKPDYKAGVLLSIQGSIDSIFDIGDIFDEFENPDVDLAAKLASELVDLLTCISADYLHIVDGESKLYSVPIHCINSYKYDTATLCSYLVDMDEPLGLDFVILVGHGASNKNKIGDLSAAKIVEVLGGSEGEMPTEVLLLACFGGCDSVGSELTTGNQIKVVACGSSVDSRCGYIFAINYLWKRFGEGNSPAQALGASNVVLSGDPYQIWYQGLTV